MSAASSVEKPSANGKAVVLERSVNGRTNVPFQEYYLFPPNVCFRPILSTMRIVIMLASILIISLLIFKGYSSYLGGINDVHVGEEQIDPLKKAGKVNQLIQDTANTQRQELEKQIQQ